MNDDRPVPSSVDPLIHDLDDRMGFQQAFYELTQAMGDDTGYGVHFDNATFEMHPYCWCASDACPQCGTHEQVNFWHKPSGLKIAWYKYPLRAANLNQQITLEAFDAIVTECVVSLATPAKA